MPFRHRTASGSPWESKYGYARAVRSFQHICVSGTTAVSPEGNVIGEGDAYKQTQYIFTVIAEALHELEASLTDVVRTRIYVVDIDSHAEAVGKAHGEIFESIRPAATMVGVAGLIAPELLVEIEVDALLSTPPEPQPPQNEH
ncbi:MAG: RidA family protein [Bacteroidetes bacterium]|nr:RidA family protein [Bacteroidota bacterium]